MKMVSAGMLRAVRPKSSGPSELSHGVRQLVGRSDLVAYNRAANNSYLAVNTLFADELVRVLRPDDVVWVHDYRMIRLAHSLRGAEGSSR